MRDVYAVFAPSGLPVYAFQCFFNERRLRCFCTFSATRLRFSMHFQWEAFTLLSYRAQWLFLDHFKLFKDYFVFGRIGVVLKRTDVMFLVVTVLSLRFLSFFPLRLRGLWCGLCGLWCGGRGGCGTYRDPLCFSIRCLKVLHNRLLACLSLLSLTQVPILLSSYTFTYQVEVLAPKYSCRVLYDEIYFLISIPLHKLIFLHFAHSNGHRISPMSSRVKSFRT